MKTLLKTIFMAVCIASLGSCKEKKTDEVGFNWIIDRFDDIKILRYQVPLFDSLQLNDKLLIYYLSEAAASGRDIFFDQNGRYNLTIRRTLEAVYQGYAGPRESEDFGKVETYLKKVWFANGIHHHYSSDKFVPSFSQEYLREIVGDTPQEFFPKDLPPKGELLAEIIPIMFDPEIFAKGVEQSPDVDMIVGSSNNFYRGVTQAEAERFYAEMANPNDKTPISYGLNSQLVKVGEQIKERKWRVGGMYSTAIEKIVYWLEKATEVASPVQKKIIESLITYYRSGELNDFDKYSILWVKDTVSKVDFVNGFIEVYQDPLGYKGTWESLVNFRDDQATKRAEIISANAQWFEDNSPVDSLYKKKVVKGVSAKVITAAMLGGDCFPATPIGVNLPNSDWIRKSYGSKSVTINNITYAYAESSKGNGFLEEFVLNSEDRERSRKYGTLGDELHTDLHECLGHGSGQLTQGIKGDELKNYGSALEECRADLFALYYLADPKLMELGLVPSMDVGKAVYSNYIMNGMMTQFARIELGKNVEEAHMRNRMIIALWCYEKGLEHNVIEKVRKGGKTYIVVNDFHMLRQLFGQLLARVQQIKSEGDYQAAKALIEGYGIRVDQQVHAEVLERYLALNLAPYSGFVNPVYSPVMEDGMIIDVKLDYVDDYSAQMMLYSKKYSFLPSKN